MARLAAQRRKALPLLINRMADEQDVMLAHSTLLGWRIAAGQQVCVRVAMQEIVCVER